jgi:predicted nucleic acid-binding protein
MRVVLDTDVMVAAVRSSRGASRRLLEDALNQRFETLLSVPLMFEYEAVLKRREHLNAAGLRPSDIDTILDRMIEAATAVRLTYSWRPVMQIRMMKWFWRRRSTDWQM